MPFIRAIRLADPGSDLERIVELLVSEFTTSRVRRLPVEAVHTAIRRGVRYRALDERTQRQTDVEARVGYGGRRHVVTVQGGAETADLLQLPRF